MPRPCSSTSAIHPSITNIGVRPTFGDPVRPVVETHVLGFDGDLYGTAVRLGFVQRLRDERAFDSVEQLRAQIDADRHRARSLFERMSL